MTESSAIGWDAADRLTGDLRCVSCGHNLRGLQRAGACGECGTPVNWSLEGSYLHAHDPEWVNGMRRGVACLGLALPWLWLPPAWVVLGYGLWRASAPDPGSEHGGPLRFAGLRVLFAAGPAVIGCVGVPLCAAYWNSRTLLPKFDPELAIMLLIAGTVLLVPLFIGAAIRRAVQWGDSPRLKRRHRSALWLSGLALMFVAGWGANELAVLNLDLLVTLGVIGLLLGVGGFGLSVACLCEAWRVLDRAEVHARARRTQVRYWRRSVPGASRGADSRVDEPERRLNPAAAPARTRAAPPSDAPG